MIIIIIIDNKNKQNLADRLIYRVKIKLINKCYQMCTTKCYFTHKYPLNVGRNSLRFFLNLSLLALVPSRGMVDTSCCMVDCKWAWSVSVIQAERRAFNNLSWWSWIIWEWSVWNTQVNDRILIARIHCATCSKV